MEYRVGSFLAALVALGCVLQGCGSDDGSACADEGLDVPSVAGSYLVELGDLRSSNCPAQVDQLLNEAIQDVDSCVYDLDQDGARILGTECEGAAVSGCVDVDGNVTVSEGASQSEQGCTVSVDGDFEANLTEADAEGSFTLRIRISGRCTLQTDCVAVVDASARQLLALTTGSVDHPAGGVVASAASHLSAAGADSR